MKNLHVFLTCLLSRYLITIGALIIVFTNFGSAASLDTSDSSGLTLAYRLSHNLWLDDDGFQKIANFLISHHAVVDEVALFNEGIEAMGNPLTGLAKNAEILKKRIRQFHEAGIRRAGINVLSTIGHGMWQKEGELPYRPLMGHDGSTGGPSGCVNDPAFHQYTLDKYSLMAKTNPDFIWVDDDFRMSHHGPVYPCFCSECLKKFGQGNNREELVSRLNAPENTALRQAWSEFCAASMESLIAGIGRTVNQINPNIEPGLMTIGYSHSTYAGYPITRWMNALGAVLGRPGHGFYTDEKPRDLLDKSMDVGRQIRDYPAKVYRREYELENYPYITLNKSVQTIMNECTIALMMGCNGIAFNMFYEDKKGNLKEYEPLFTAVTAERQSWERIVRNISGQSLRGFWPADHPMLMANRKVGDNGWFWEGKEYNIQQPNKIAEVGIPLTPDPRTACGVLLSGKIAEAFSDAELRKMLSGAVYMDQEALQVLWDRGLGQYTGVKPGKKGNGVTERLTNHPINSPYGGDSRRCFPWAFGIPLIPLSDKVQDLAHTETLDGIDGGCSLALYENELGGRIAVSSYSAWNDMGRTGKRQQLLSVADWLTKAQLPVIIEEMARVAPFIRIADDGKRFTLILWNASFDNSGPLTVRLRANPDTAWLLSNSGQNQLKLEKKTDETILRVPSVSAWSTVTVIGE